jgi:D-alanyl-D-alanine carboxypeptidase
MADPMINTVTPRILDRVTELLAKHGLPGAAVGVVRDQELVWSQGFGLADVETGRAPDEHTLFRVASITKTFTATAIVQLRDEGKLQLDDPLVRYLPELAAARNPFGPIEDVTLLRMLTHRSGLMGEPPLDHWETLRFPSMAEILDSLPRVQVAIEPDSAFKYSNLALALLGEVVTRVSGRPYTEHVRTRILEPLGMASSGFELSETLRARLAIGYGAHPFEDAGTPTPHPLLNGETSAGQLYSSVHDLARWIALQLRADDPEGETPVLSQRSLRDMHRPRYMEPDWTAGYCLGWLAARRGDEVVLRHSGALHGYMSEVRFSKARKLGVIVLLNGIGPAQQIGAEVMDLLVAADDEAKRPEPLERPVPTPPEWTRFLGTYRIATLGAEQRIECRRGSLLLVTPQPSVPGPERISLEPTDEPHVFMVRGGRYAGEPLTFRQAEDGTVSGFVSAGFAYRKQVEAGSA